MDEELENNEENLQQLDENQNKEQEKKKDEEIKKLTELGEKETFKQNKMFKGIFTIFGFHQVVVDFLVVLFSYQTFYLIYLTSFAYLHPCRKIFLY